MGSGVKNEEKNNIQTKTLNHELGLNITDNGLVCNESVKLIIYPL